MTAPLPTRRCLLAAVLAACTALALALLSSCAAGNLAGQPDATTASAAATPAQPESEPSASTAAQPAPEPEAPAAPVTYPAAWLAADANGIAAGTAVQVMQLPDLNVTAHRSGQPISAEEQKQLSVGWPQAGAGEALVEHDGTVTAVPAYLLLVNLPDLPLAADYDIVYAYASTSRCAGQDIPGVTGQRLPGYADGKQENPYLGTREFVVPCAYGTARKVKAAADELSSQDLRLLVYDAYRPMTAQLYLSDAFQTEFWNNQTMQESLNGWALTWYVADGASGHNYGASIDVGVCDAQGNPLPMPSAFDAFDESGHLATAPMSSESITQSSYCSTVLQNDACMALHDAFTHAGFSELASEWWHFSDVETETALRAAVGDGGLDFVA